MGDVAHVHDRETSVIRTREVELRVVKVSSQSVVLEDWQTTRVTALGGATCCGVTAGDTQRITPEAVECLGGWLVARGAMRVATTSGSSKTAVGVSAEVSQKCERCILQRVLGARNTRSQPATGARQEERSFQSGGDWKVNQKLAQQSKVTTTSRDDETRAKWT